MHPPTLRRPYQAVARPAAVTMVGCAAVHAVCAVQHWTPGLSLLAIGVALACLHCVPGLWTTPRVRDWVWVTLGSAAMLVLHLGMLAAPTGSRGHAHPTVAAGPPLDPLTVLGLVLPVVGLALAWCALGSLRVRVPFDEHRPDRRRDR